ncbi:nitrite reductase small subunit NirD [Bacillus sp. V5-8f]|uniref:nitrite reductase small subunit NirD n=1 Tax=Bacillus sp. V5-8f TaxID=2053044 RepID=UPI000C787122|nr:nitrite reductase small subunit NirD [Bacillus sp. V5-8f]PLT32150.1 nitrite reductase (NAD(P)H) small subunit [Bacillus sp. V5-8f]
MVNKSIMKVLVGPAGELAERIGKTVYVGDKEVAVFKLLNGSIRAVENRCPHKGGVLAEGMVSGDFVFCPMHDCKICLQDGQVQEPDTGCVKTFKTLVEDGKVYVLMEE